MLIINRSVAIIGHPHVGKTISAFFLGITILKELNLRSLYIVQLIDLVEDLPTITNSIIIFDDLFGDITYESIGRKTIIVNTLANYIIITSRDYIFDLAKNDDFQLFSLKAPHLLQEGSYNNDDLELILNKHVKIKEKEFNLSDNIKTIINDNKNLIINELRFPHNIELFVSSLDKLSNKGYRLKDLIRDSKKIEKLILNWVEVQDNYNKQILLISSIFRTLSINDLCRIIKENISGKDELILKIIKYNNRIINLQNDIIIFKHPSFRKIIYDHYLDEHINVIVNLITHELKNESLSPSLQNQFMPIIKDIIGFIKLKDLVSLLYVKISVKLLPFIWSDIIKKNNEVCLTEYLKIKNQKEKDISLQDINMALFRARELLKKKDIIRFVKYLFNVRESKDDRIIDKLIYQFSFSLRDLVPNFIENLNRNNRRDLFLIIHLYHCISSTDTDYVFNELLKLSKHNDSYIRNKVYHIMSSFPHRFLLLKMDVFYNLLDKENNEYNKTYLSKSIQRIKKKSHPYLLNNNVDCET